MNNVFDRVIKYTFYSLFFLTPLIFYPYTSEIFEFNKIVFVYLVTIIITTSWICKSVAEQKIVFRRTIVDIPILLFLFSQLISTFTSIDFHTSLFGYYSRFNGGLFSSICYSILYWAFVSNMTTKRVKKIFYLLLFSTFLVGVYAFFEHFGKSFSCLIVTGKFNVACWVQDVQNRVFATFGQPNWLAAWIVALTPISWVFYQNSKKINLKTIFFLLSLFLFLILLYTKSRSGILGFAISFIIFWGGILLKHKTKHIPLIIFTALGITTLAFFIGTPWTKNLNQRFLDKHSYDDTRVKEVGPALETGGTESGEIRKIVWKGAVDVWKHYPIFGSGVETFAFSYYEFRPREHNLVSEWDFVYNKAHNEYLNFAATTGAFGLLAYLFLTGSILYLMLKNVRVDQDPTFQIALISGFTSILITNSFGFSVVASSLLFFIFPAFSVVLVDQSETKPIKKNNNLQKLIIGVFMIAGSLLFYKTLKYWQADFLFARAQALNRNSKFAEARSLLTRSLEISPNESVYLNELATSTAFIASSYHESEKESDAKTTSRIFDLEIQKALVLSPRNLNIKRNAASFYTKLSSIDSTFLIKANSILKDSEILAPTDPKTKLNLAGSYIRLGEKQKAEKTLRDAVALKPNYKEARYALAAVLADRGEKKEAIDNLNYILKNVDPFDKNFKALIEDIEKQ